jgi:hypothetical protein
MIIPQDVLGVVYRLLGDEPAMCQWAVDTPLKGSQYQVVHRDAAPLYPDVLGTSEVFPEPPTTQLAINFPLIDVIPAADNGPVQIAKGTHLLTVEQGQRYQPLQICIPSICTPSICTLYIR